MGKCLLLLLAWQITSGVNTHDILFYSASSFIGHEVSATFSLFMRLFSFSHTPTRRAPV